MTTEIDLALLFKVLKSAWWKILLFTVAVAIAVAALTVFVIPKKYTSTTVFYVINTSVSNEYTTTSLLSASEQLSKDYIEIIKSDALLSRISEELAAGGHGEHSPAKLRGMLSATTTDEASTFSITVTSASKELSFAIAESIQANAPEVIKTITRPSYTANLYIYQGAGEDGKISVDDFVRIDESDLECVKIIRNAKLASNHNSPSLPKNVLLGSIVAAVLAYAFVLIRRLMDTAIRTEDDVKAALSCPVIGIVPIWTPSSDADKANKY